MKTKSLAFIAGIIWLFAGFNVCRIGVLSWMSHGMALMLAGVIYISTLLCPKDL